MRLLETFDEEDDLVDFYKILDIIVVCCGKQIVLSSKGVIKGSNYSRVFVAMAPLKVLRVDLRNGNEILPYNPDKMELRKDDLIRFHF